MKTVRFSQVVKKAGKPTVHLQLVDASEDRDLKKAVKLKRVMTISQSTVGHATDYGTVGLDSKRKGQVLIFPKSLASFADLRVVGIKYEMLEEPVIPKGKLAPKTPSKNRRRSGGTKQPQNRTGRAAQPQEKTVSDLEGALREASRSELSIKPPFEKKQSPQSTRKQDDDDRIQGGIRDALLALEEGQSGKAYKILQRLERLT